MGPGLPPPHAPGTVLSPSFPLGSRQRFAAGVGFQPALPPESLPCPSSVRTCPPVGALAVEGGHAVVAGGAREAGSAGAVVNVLAAVLPGPAVDAHAVVGAMGVVAGAPVLAGVGHQLALVHVFSAVLAWGWGWGKPRGQPSATRESLPRRAATFSHKSAVSPSWGRELSSTGLH